MAEWDLLAELAVLFARLSLFAVGGVTTLLPEMHRLLVEQHGWVTETQFTTLYAIAQGAPGPNILVVAALGWQVAGVPGAITSLVAVCAPATTLAAVVAHLRDRVAGTRGARIVQSGLVPATVGLVAASAILLARGAAQSSALPGVAVTLTVATLVIVVRLNPHPLWLLAGGAAIGAAVGA